MTQTATLTPTSWVTSTATPQFSTPSLTPTERSFEVEPNTLLFEPQMFSSISTCPVNNFLAYNFLDLEFAIYNCARQPNAAKPYDIFILSDLYFQNAIQINQINANIRLWGKGVGLAPNEPKTVLYGYSSTSPTIKNELFVLNRAGVQLEIHNLVISDGGGDGVGGAISQTAGTLKIYSSILENNEAERPTTAILGVGGAIHSKGGLLEIYSSLFRSNKASYAAAIHFSSQSYAAADLRIDCTRFENNVAQYHSAVIMVEQSQGRVITITRSTIINNSRLEDYPGATLKPRDVLYFNSPNPPGFDLTYNYWGSSEPLRPDHIADNINPPVSPSLNTANRYTGDPTANFLVNPYQGSPCVMTAPRNSPIPPTPSPTPNNTGGGAEQTPTATPSFAHCTVIVNVDILNLRANPTTTATVLGTINRGITITVIGQTSGGEWYNVIYGQYGWVKASSTHDLSCPSGGIPSSTPTVAVPVLTRISYKTANGQTTFEPVDPAHDFSLYKNLLPPCNQQGAPITYLGEDVRPDTRFDRQYDVMDQAPSGQLEFVRNLHFGPDDTSPIITPRPDRPSPSATDSPEYQQWVTDWTNPSEDTRRAYEIRLLKGSDNNSCGFVTLAYAMNYLNITTNIHPNVLMINAASCQANGTCTYPAAIPHPNGVNLTRNGFGSWHFLNEIGNNILENGNAFPQDVALVEDIITMVKTNNTIVMALVRVDRKPGNEYEREGVVKRDGGLLTGVQVDISHWVLVTGVSENGQWFRILNPLNNQVEYYNIDEFDKSRTASDNDIIKVSAS